MRSKLTLFAAVCVAAVALSTPASAGTVLAFSQSTTTDFVMATVAGSTTTLDTNGGVGTTNSIPITITSIGGTLLPVGIPATETFNPALRSTIASMAAPGGTGVVQNGFNGTIVIALANGTDNNVLTATITNGVLTANGASGAFNAASFTSNGGQPTIVTLSSDFPAVIAALGGTSAPGAAALSLVNITPTQSGSGFASFTGQNTGNFSTATATPEPASVVSAGTAILAGLGCFGWSRRKSSKV